MALTYLSLLDLATAGSKGYFVFMSPRLSSSFLSILKRMSADPHFLDRLDNCRGTDYDHPYRTSTSSCTAYHFAPMTFWVC